MRQPALERIGDQIMPVAARKGLDQQGAGIGDDRARRLHLQPFLHIRRQDAPVVAVLDHGPHPVRQRGRHGKFVAAPGRDLGVLVDRLGDQGVHAVDALEGPDLTGEDEGVAGRHLFEIVLLGLTDLAPAGQLFRSAPAPGGDTHIQRRRRHDRPDIHPVALGRLGVPDGPPAIPRPHDPREPLIGAQRIAAGGDQIDHSLELFIRQTAIGAATDNLCIQIIQRKGFGTGAPHDVLRERIQRARVHRLPVEGVCGHGLARCLALQHLEPAGRDHQGARRLIQPVIGPSDPLHQPRRALRRRHLDHQIDIAPVDAEIERRGTDHGP